MSGFELILSAVLCITCGNNTSRLPPNLILLEEDRIAAGFTNETVLPSDAAVPEVSTAANDPPLYGISDEVKALRAYINGRHFRIATLEDYPLSYTEMLTDGRLVGRGVSFQVIDFLCKKFNFTYDVVVPSGNIIGSDNDFENSLLQMINSSEVDMAAAFIPLLSEARKYVYYSTTLLDEGEWVMVMQRPRESASGSGLLAPFDTWVWLLIVVTVLVVGPIIYLLILLRNKLTGDTEQKTYSLSHCAWFVYGGLMKQGSTLSPIADSTRILFATWWIFITILTAFYTANLTAFLTLSEFTLPFNTVGDILNKQKQFVTHRGNGVEYAIRGTNESLGQLSKMIQNKRAVFTKIRNDTQTLHTFVERSGHVFVRDRPAISHVLYKDYRYRKTLSKNNERIHCPFATAKHPFLRKKRTFAYPNHSNLSQLFDPELLNLMEAGIIKHLLSAGLPNAEICPQNLGGTERQLENRDLLLTYYITFSGFGTAFLVLLIEIIIRWLSQRCCKSKQRTSGQRSRRTLNRRDPALASRWAYHPDLSRSNKQHLASYGNSNITPPPPYQSIYNSRKNNGQSKKNNNLSRWHQADVPGLVNDSYIRGFTGTRQVINGRDYVVYRTPNGQNQLVPTRAPSATLFQYAYRE